jgi:Highly conserved protein containing a thioredoxin domain
MTPPGNAQLFTPQQDLEDGVMPAGASEAAMNFWWYGTLFNQPELLTHCDKLLAAARERVNWLPSGAQWAEVMAARAGETLEIGIVGGSPEEVARARQTLRRAGWWPQAVWFGAANEAAAVDSPLFAGRFSNKTRMFICQQGACQLPCATVEEAIDQIQSLPPHT